MRNNQPVSQKECLIPDHAAIISRTDAKGIITHVNDDFVQLSGFSRCELIGQPHSILRHPDMPSEAFRDLWATLKAGRPWNGYVKNRCKNGDHYWVKATATPTPDGGYMSVRVRPTRDEVLAAEELFARMRQDPGVRLEAGLLRKGGLSAQMSRLVDMGLATKLWVTTLASMVAVLTAVFVGWVALGMVLGDLKPGTAADIAPFRTGLLVLAGVTLVAWPWWPGPSWPGGSSAISTCPCSRWWKWPRALPPSISPGPCPRPDRMKWASCCSSSPSCATTCRRVRCASSGTPAAWAGRCRC